MGRLRALLQEHERAKQSEQLRLKRRVDVRDVQAVRLIEAMADAGVFNIPISVNGSSGELTARRTRTGVEVCSQERITWPVLTVFECCVDHDGTRGWLEHDGDEVTVDIALQIVGDLAEKHFRLD